MLERATRSLSEGTLTAELRDSANPEAHTLAGSVSFFGFTVGSAVDHDLELRFAAMPEARDAPVLAELVAALRRAIEGPDPIGGVRRGMPLATCSGPCVAGPTEYSPAGVELRPESAFMLSNGGGRR